MTAIPALHVYRDADDNVPKGAVIALGNFDGVHLGHRAVIGSALKMARESGRPALAMTFEPHPGDFFSPDKLQFWLSDDDTKLRLLAATGLDGVVVLTFDAKRAATTALDFINHDLIGRLGVAGVSVGYDFHFGKGRSGSPHLLLSEGANSGFNVHIEPRFAIDGQPVSSSAIRSALIDGRIETASKLLGHPWVVASEVIHGEKRGRDLGFPTANIRLDPGCGLRHGIYAVRIGRGTERFDGVASFGRRPTFDNGAPLLEVFLFDFEGNLYGTRLDVAFVGFIRDEMKFDSVEALIARINEDSAAARKILAAAPDAFPALGTIS